MSLIGVTKRKRGRPGKWPMAQRNDVPADYGAGRKLEGKELKARKKVLEAEDRERRRPK
jgi:hypothetical protein